MKKPRKPKTERQKLIKACDDIFRKIIRIRDKGLCQVTFRPDNVQVAHYWTRGNLRVRWDLDNACLLNAAKHIWWAHANPEQFKTFWIRRLGRESFDALELRARYVSPIKEYDLIFINQDLKAKLQSLAEGQING